MGSFSGGSGFVGRGDEVAAFDDLVRSLPSHGARTVLLAGEAGIGKSRLVGELRRLAAMAGALVATGRTTVEGEALPFGPVVGLVRDLVRQVPADRMGGPLATTQRLLLGSSAEAAGPAHVARLVLFESMLDAVDDTAADRPLVLVLEDLHWADPASIELLDHLVRNLEHQPVLIVATFRPDVVDSRPTARRVLAELRHHPAVLPMALGGLQQDEIGALLAEVTGQTPSWAVVDAVYRRSEGNPLFAEELADVTEGSSLPPALQDLLTVRVDQLPPLARQAVAALAVLGASADHRLLAATAELDADDLHAGVTDAVRHGVLITDASARLVRFRHALLRDAAHDALLPTQRTRLHQRAAGALIADSSLAAAGPGHAAAELAEHHAEAGEWAAACVESIAAAQASTALYSMHAAHTHLQRALDAHRRAAGRCDHPSVDDAELNRLAAETAYLVGDLELGLHLGQAALAALPPATSGERRAGCVTLIAKSAGALGKAETAFGVIATAEEALQAEARGPGMAEVVTMHARLLMAAGRAAEGAERSQEALLLARRTGARISEGHALATLGPCLSELGAHDDATEATLAALAVAEEVGEPDLLMRAYNNHTDTLFVAGRLEEAAQVALDATHGNEPLDTIRLGSAGFNGAEALIVLGRWDEAAALSALLVGKASAACISDSLNTARLALRRGALDAAMDALAGQVGAGPQSTSQRELLLAELALEQDRPSDASAAVDRALTSLVGADFGIELLRAHALGLRSLADQAAQPVRSGRRNSDDPDKLRRVAESMLADVEATVAAERGSSPWITALRALCRAEAARVVGPDPVAWSVAVSAMDQLCDRYHSAYCLAREAEARLADRGDRRMAVETLAEAWHAARQLGAPGLVARCERLAERARVTLEDPNGPEATPQQRAAADLGLTPREAEVLDLLAKTWTDAQIADELFISKKTASVHVSNILRKLDARDRWEAGEIARGVGLGST